MNIKDVKQYLSSLVVVLRGMNDPTGMQAKTCECITALLDHCEDMENHVPEIILRQAGVTKQ